MELLPQSYVYSHTDISDQLPVLLLQKVGAKVAISRCFLWATKVEIYKKNFPNGLDGFCNRRMPTTSIHPGWTPCLKHSGAV
jgi:hypothetical protein